MKPEIYAIQRGRSGWKLSRRELAAAAAAAGAAAMLGCGGTEGEKPGPCKGIAAHEKRVRGLAFSPDGKLLVSGSDDGSLKLWSMPGGALTNTLKADSDGVSAVAISPGGRMLVSGSRYHGITRWALP